MSLKPGQYTFTIYPGATFYKRITFKVNGEVQDLTGYDAQFVVKDEPDGTVLLTLDVGDGITLGGVDGTIDISVNATDTANLTWQAGIYELFITDTSNHTDVLLYGNIKVRPF